MKTLRRTSGSWCIDLAPLRPGCCCCCRCCRCCYFCYCCCCAAVVVVVVVVVVVATAAAAAAGCWWCGCCWLLVPLLLLLLFAAVVAAGGEFSLLAMVQHSLSLLLCCRCWLGAGSATRRTTRVEAAVAAVVVAAAAAAAAAAAMAPTEVAVSAAAALLLPAWTSSRLARRPSCARRRAGRMRPTRALAATCPVPVVRPLVNVAAAGGRCLRGQRFPARTSTDRFCYRRASRPPPLLLPPSIPRWCCDGADICYWPPRRLSGHDRDCADACARYLHLPLPALVRGAIPDRAPHASVQGACACLACASCQEEACLSAPRSPWVGGWVGGGVVPAICVFFFFFFAAAAAGGKRV
jgi:hypothetical protein